MPLRISPQTALALAVMILDLESVVIAALIASFQFTKIAWLSPFGLVAEI
jgi:hypothetical protein